MDALRCPRWWILTDVIARLEPGVLFTRHDLKRVGTEVITLKEVGQRLIQTKEQDPTHLRLQEVRGDDLAAVTVEEGKRSAERGGRDAPENSLGNNTPPAGLGLVHSYTGEGK